MSTKFITALALSALVLAAHCADEKLPTLKVGSQVYSNVTVTTVTPTDIHFFYAHGIGNAKLKDLDPEMQQHFHFNADTAQTAEQQRAAGTAAYLNKIESRPPPTLRPPTQLQFGQHRRPPGLWTLWFQNSTPNLFCIRKRRILSWTSG